MIEQKIAHLAAEPFIDRNTKAHFRAFKDGCRNELFPGLTQYPLGARSPDPAVIGQC